MARVLVVGAGVVGLTVAVRLLEEGHRVDVVARDLPLETTSAVAGGFWYPHLAEPRDRVLAWAARSREVFVELAATEPDCGVAVRAGTEVFRRPAPDPWWSSAVPGLHRPQALPGGYRDGISFEAPIAEMPVYLRWLQGRVADLGGTVTRMVVHSLPDGPEVVVDAAGMGARFLAGDHTVQPVRGQVLRVAQFGLDRWWLDSGEDGDQAPTYVFPRSRDVVVGGTEDAGDWTMSASPETAGRILRRAAALVPALAGAEVLAHAVGLRPSRPTVRLEREGRVVHCYGHGGAGVTVSWGCAEEVARLVGGR